MIDRAYDRLLLADTDPSLRQPTRGERRRDHARRICLTTPQRTGAPISRRSPSSATFRPKRVRAALEASFGTWNASGPKPDPHLMAMPPACERPRLHRHRRQPSLHSSRAAGALALERGLRYVRGAQSDPRRQRSLRIAPVARAAPKTRPRLQRQQLAGGRCRSRRSARRAQRVAAARRRSRDAGASGTQAAARGAGLADGAAGGEGTPRQQRAARGSFVIRAGQTDSSTSPTIVCRSITTARSTSASRGSPRPTCSGSHASTCTQTGWSKSTRGPRARGRCARYDRDDQPGDRRSRSNESSR